MVDSNAGHLVCNVALEGLEVSKSFDLGPEVKRLGIKLQVVMIFTCYH